MFTYNDENELLTIEQMCEKLFISHTTAYKLLQSGEIKAFKLGTWKIPAKSVYEYINKRVGKKIIFLANSKYILKMPLFILI